MLERNCLAWNVWSWAVIKYDIIWIIETNVRKQYDFANHKIAEFKQNVINSGKLAANGLCFLIRILNIWKCRL